MIQFQQALEHVLQEITPLQAEVCRVDQAHGRVLARGIEAPADIPALDNSSMDGYALRSIDTLAASSNNRVRLQLSGEVAAGHVFQNELKPLCTIRIFTGAPVPRGADAVLEQEAVEREGESILLHTPVTAGRNVRLRGEDIEKGRIVLEAGETIEAARLGVLASLGLSEISVFSIPHISIVTTGDELLNPDEPLQAGKIRDSNSFTLSALVAEAGCKAGSVTRSEDTTARLVERIRQGLSTDALITSGGVSVGEHDLVLSALKAIGVEIHFWKVNIKPGMPFAFGVYRHGRDGRRVPVFALPGNPVSSMLTFVQFVRPALLKMRGANPHLGIGRLSARMEHGYLKRDGKRHFVRGILRNNGNELLVRTTGNQGSGVLTSMKAANCLIILPEELIQVQAGDFVDVELLSHNAL